MPSARRDGSRPARVISSGRAAAYAGLFAAAFLVATLPSAQWWFLVLVGVGTLGRAVVVAWVVVGTWRVRAAAP